jgi:hypothetical protein
VISSNTEYQLESIASIGAEVLMKGEVGVRYVVNRGGEQPFEIELNAIHAPATTRFTVIPRKREEMIRFLLDRLNVYKRSTHPGSSLIDLEIKSSSRIDESIFISKW